MALPLFRSPWVPLFVLSASVVSFSQENPTVRFHRLLAHYTDPNYAVTVSHVTVAGSYNSTSRDSVMAVGGTALSSSDDYSSLDRSADLKVGYTLTALRGAALFTDLQEIKIEASGIYHRTASSISNTVINKRDQSDRTERFGKLTGSYRKAEDRYPQWSAQSLSPLLKDWFYGSDGTIQGNFSGYDDTESVSDQLSRTYRRDRYKWHTIGDGFGEVLARIGKGRIVPVQSLYHTLEIERLLIERRIIDKPLVDEKVLAIARWYNIRMVDSLRHNEPEKFFYRGLDSILSADSGVIVRKPEAFEYFRISQSIRYREGMIIPAGVKLYAGYHITVSGSGGYDTRREWYYSSTGTREPDDFGLEAREWTPDHHEDMKLGLTAGFPLTDRSFLSLDGSCYDLKNLLSPHPSYTLGMHYRYLFTDRIYGDLFFDQSGEYLSDMLFTWPQTSGAEIAYYLEDHCKLELRFEKYNTTKSIYSCRPCFRRDIDTRTEKIILGVTYEM